ncbi:hypothetical protein RCH33_2299 [Flavobacterium daejeonense]|nr:hypothetical protein RCH33_2299 [Flavobacterium daejeonense]
MPLDLIYVCKYITIFETIIPKRKNFTKNKTTSRKNPSLLKFIPDVIHLKTKKQVYIYNKGKYFGK